MGDSLLEFSFRSGRKTRFFYKNKNAALSVSWSGNENSHFPGPTEITLFVSDGDIEIDDNGRISSIPYSIIPLPYGLRKEDLPAGRKGMDKHFITGIADALNEARVFLLEKEEGAERRRVQHFEKIN